jgi:hypothetical protein
MAEERRNPTLNPVAVPKGAFREDSKGFATQDQRQELRTMAKPNEQTQDLKKSINVFNTNTGAKNPFLQNNTPQSQSQPAPATNNATATNNAPAKE